MNIVNVVHSNNNNNNSSATLLSIEIFKMTLMILLIHESLIVHVTRTHRIHFTLSFYALQVYYK